MDIDREALLRDGRRILRQWQGKADRAVAGRQVSGAQACLLRYILDCGEDGTTAADLRQVFGSSSATLSRLLKRLRAAGYVRVTGCPGDGRRRMLTGTERAENLRPFIDDSIARTLEQLYRGLSQRELAQLDRIQKKMLRNLSAEDTES